VAALADEDVRGAWFLDPPRGGGRGPSAVERALAERGALGVLLGGRELLITGGNWRIDFDELPTTPRVYLHPDDYERIKELMAGEEPVHVEIDVRNYFKRGPIPLYNVIAELRGRELPDQYVIVGGHIDSWDGATGTTDNGTGVATTLEAARLLTAVGATPRRTIRFMLWSGEEQGLLGSRAYIDRHPEELERISAVLVHDGGTNYVSGITCTPAMEETMRRVFAPVTGLTAEMPFEIKIQRTFMPIGSDHDSYCARGVPGFFWRQAGRVSYQRTHHTQYDTFDAAVAEYQEHSSKVIAIGALGLAEEPELLTRDDFAYRRMFGAPPATRSGPQRILGITTGEDTTITSVLPDSLAQKAGLREGDRILKVGADEVAESYEIARALRNGPASTSVVVRRGDQEVTVPIEFEKEK
jgi:hypothetical protein